MDDEPEPYVPVWGRQPEAPPRPEWDVPISNGACELMAVLLKGGATELAVCGALENPAAIQEAVDASPAFEALTLGENRKGAPTEYEKWGYATLLTGTRTCARLKHLTLLHAEILVALHGYVKKVAPSLPALQSLTLVCGTSAASPYVRWLLEACSTSVALTKVALSFRAQDAEHLIEEILEPLKSHRSLAELVLSGPSYTNGYGKRVFFLGIPIAALEVAVSCPSMRSLVCDTDADFVDAGVSMAFFEGIYSDLIVRARVVGEALQDPACQLEAISLRGFPMLLRILEPLMHAVAHNRSLAYLDLSGCGIHMVSTQQLMASLATNNTLRNVVLPDSPGNYYLTVKDPTHPEGTQGAVYGFHRFQTHHTSTGGSRQNDFRPVDGAFDPALKEHADTFQQQLVDRRVALLRQDALPALALDVARVLTAYAVDQKFKETTLGAYQDVAIGVVEALEKQGALRDVVHLSQTRKLDDFKPIEYATQREKNVKPYVRLHNREADAQDLPNAPLSVNAVDQHGANKELMEAIRTNKPEDVSILLSRDAIDFGGRAQRSAPPGPLRNAFLPINRMDTAGTNVQLQACVDRNDPHGLRRLIAQGAIDFGGRVESGARGALRKSFLPVNRVDEYDANVQLMAAVKTGDAGLVVRLRAQGAVDYGRRAFALTQTMQSRDLRAAFAKVAVTGRRTTTVTTTNTTATTTTTAATRSRFQQTRVPRNTDKPDA